MCVLSAGIEQPCQEPGAKADIADRSFYRAESILL